MNVRIRIATAAAALAVVAACGAGRDVSSSSAAVLSDGRSDGAEGFYFLPPVAPQPSDETGNDRGLSPVVEIVPLTPPGAPVFARFEGDDVKSSGAHYMVHWSTKQYVPVPGTTYRIRVLLDDVVLGYADAAVALNGRQLRMLASEEIFGLTGQRTVPIKFRIHVGEGSEEDLCLGVVCPSPAPCEAVACNPATGACETTPLADETVCDDGNPCTATDVCGAGLCVPGPARVCPDLDDCNKGGACDPVTECSVTVPQVDTNCIQTGGEFPGTQGICKLDPQRPGFSYCADIGGSKLSR
jgi:hypothetical protein